MDHDLASKLAGMVLGIALVLVAAVRLNPMSTPTLEIADLSRDGSTVSFTVRWSQAHAQDHILDVDARSGGTPIEGASSYFVLGKASGERRITITAEHEAEISVSITDVGGDRIRTVNRRI